MMKKTVIGPVARIYDGVLFLTKEQAESRALNLKSLGEDKYQVINPVEFKQGEEIGFDGDVPKGLAAVFGEDEAPANTGGSNEPTVAELKAKLDALKAEYPAKAKKEALLELLAAAEKAKETEADDVAELKKQLDELEVEYAEDADKATLETLLNEALAD